MPFKVTHRTQYRYESEVSSSYGQLHLLPRDLSVQRCRISGVDFEPVAHDYREHVDFFGNRAAYFSILTPHTSLVVTATSVVEVSGRDDHHGDDGVDVSWRKVRDALATPEGTELADAAQFVLDSPLVEASAALAALARPHFTARRGVLDGARALVAAIHRDFEYEPGSTSVTTAVDEVLAERRGVCQDFAHVAIGALRSVGLAARYVSGYLETDPPPGVPRLVGADVSHAWLAVFVPGRGWVDLDPTNDQVVGDRYVTTAWGRDYGDVAPLKGVIYTEGTSNELDVSVDVVRV